jgi:fructan beta-fructosidase
MMIKDTRLRIVKYSISGLIAFVGCCGFAQVSNDKNTNPAVSSQPQAPAGPTDLTPAEVADQQNYDQPLRPQFHYTTIQGHIGDATGLVYYKGEYHLFNIFDEWSRKNGAPHKRWGHAISTDLLHWTQMPAVLDTIIDHAPGSGSGVVDWNNSSGLRTGTEKTIVVFYTDYAKGSSILYSNDKGRTWTRYKNNPVLDGFANIRDPNVFWYSPANEWRMIRYEKKGFVFYRSSDLIHWAFLSRIEGFYECPDLFELPIVNVPGESKWVLVDGDGSYMIGRFDGTQFIPESERLRAEYGTAFYASQTWKRPPAEHTAYQMAWLRYPPIFDLTWDGQMSFPVKLSLQKFQEGIRLTREPIDEIENLRASQRSWKDLAIAGERKMGEVKDDLLDIRTEIDPAGADEFGLEVHGQTIRYSASRHELQVGAVSAPLTLPDGKLRLRILVDRSSVEIYADDGEVTFSLIDLEKKDQNLRFFATGGKATIVSLEVDCLESIWPDRHAGETGYSH